MRHLFTPVLVVEDRLVLPEQDVFFRLPLLLHKPLVPLCSCLSPRGSDHATPCQRREEDHHPHRSSLLGWLPRLPSLLLSAGGSALPSAVDDRHSLRRASHASWRPAR